MLSIIEAANKDVALKQAITDEVTKADKDLVGPLLQFRNWGFSYLTTGALVTTALHSAPTTSRALR
jgi:hypothetical protein